MTKAETETATGAATDASTPAQVTAVAAVTTKKSFTRGLVDANKNQLRFIANLKKDGKVETYIVHRELNADGKLKLSKRGATTIHENMDSAKATVETGVKVAIKSGWQEKKSSGGGGYKARPDSFTLDTLPSPTKAAK